jgi:hypothetical protein
LLELSVDGLRDEWRAFFHRAENWLWKHVYLGFIREFHQPERGKHDSKRSRHPDELQ